MADPSPRTLECGSQLLLRFLRGRWFVIAVGILVMITSAGAYSFGLYSQKLKSVLNIDQQQMNLVANFKDLGVNLGIPAGLIYDFSSPAVVLLVGSVEASLGYALAWLSLTSRLSPSLWQMCLFLFIGSNSQPMFNTAVLVHAVKMFPASRGVVISLMKGYVGISGAILIQVFVAMQGSKNPEAFLLMLVWLPSTVAIMAMFVIRPGVKSFEGFPENKWFYCYLGLGFALAFYLMGVNIATNVSNVGMRADRGIGGGLLVLLVVPLLAISYVSEFKGKQSVEGKTQGVDIERLGEQNPSGEQQTPGAPEKALESISAEAAEAEAAASVGKKKQKTQQPSTPWPQRGADHTIPQALRSLDFWLLFVATIFGVGSGLTATDNMAQLGLSFGYPPTSVRTFVSLLSIWNSIGRWVGGFLSDFLLYHYGFARTQFHVISLLGMATAYLLLATNAPACLYYGSILLGLSFGTQYPIYTTIVSEEFGLKRFATLYNCLNISCSIGNYILSGPVAGRFYDDEAKRQAERSPLASTTAKLVCNGPVCFRRTCFTLMGVSIGAAAFAGVLWYRTRGFYSDLHLSFQKAKRAESASHGGADSQEENHEEDGASQKNNHRH